MVLYACMVVSNKRNEVSQDCFVVVQQTAKKSQVVGAPNFPRLKLFAWRVSKHEMCEECLNYWMVRDNMAKTLLYIYFQWARLPIVGRS